MKVPGVLAPCACIALIGGLLLDGGKAQAATCTVSATPIVFSSIDILSGAAVNAEGRLTVTCTTSVLDIGSLGYIPVCPSINAGSAGASGGIRKLSNGSGLLSYQLYQDAARTLPWGSSSDSSLGDVPRIDVPVTIPVIGTGGGSLTVPVYAVLMGSQTTASLGTYTSSLGITARYGVLTVAVVGGCGTILGLLSQTATNSFSVSATIDKNCLITTQDVNFGTRGVLSGNVDATGQVRVTCTNTTAYSVALGVGSYTATTRRMTNGSNYVVYGLYQNAARTQPWGSDPAGSDTVSGTGTGLTQSLSVYARVAPQTTPPAGTYTDSVVVTVTY